MFYLHLIEWFSVSSKHEVEQTVRNEEVAAV